MYPDLAPSPANGEPAGVPGVGPGFAAKGIGEYGSLDAVIETTTQGGRRAEALREIIDNVVGNRRLNQLVTDLDLNVTLEDTATPRPGCTQHLLRRVEFRTIRKRADTLGPPSCVPPDPLALPSSTASGRRRRKSAHRPRLRTHCLSAPTKNADAVAFRAFCAAAPEENYGADRQGAHRRTRTPRRRRDPLPGL